jgi:hypothetical protein
MGIRQQPNIMSAATDRRIADLLVRARMSLRRQRRENGFYHRLAETGRNPRADLERELDGLLPPRRDWPRPSREARRAANHQGRDATALALTNWLLQRWSTPRAKSEAWLIRLRRFVGQVRHRVREWSSDSKIEAPEVYALLKAHSKQATEPDLFRCLMVYSVRDRLVISIAARHLREQTDALMHSGSLAFRTQSPPLTHHDAVERILSFRRAAEESGVGRLWVTEVDIRGFFDVVSHSIAQAAVKKLIARLPPAAQPDNRALAILDAYLASYSFNGFGRERCLEKARRRSRRGFAVAVPWPEAQLIDLGVDIESDRVGIPQGGALSCFLANAILDSADWVVDREATRGGASDATLYLRYCDDIIFLAGSPESAERVVRAYTAALTELQLPFHALRTFDRRYEGSRESSKRDDGFWAGKSKAPYAWGPPAEPSHVPWCSFVGYQIRFDGLMCASQFDL